MSKSISAKTKNSSNKDRGSVLKTLDKIATSFDNDGDVGAKAGGQLAMLMMMQQQSQALAQQIQQQQQQMQQQQQF